MIETLSLAIVGYFLIVAAMSTYLELGIKDGSALLMALIWPGAVFIVLIVCALDRANEH